MSSTDHSSEVMFLVKKIGEPFAYTRANEFEIFNTEARAQLFSHAFGYKQKAFDFGVDFATNNSILEHPSPILQIHSNESIIKPDLQFSLATPMAHEPFITNTKFLIRQFVVARIRSFID